MSEAPDTPDVPKSGKDFKATLGKKVGPLPLGVWILAIGGGLVFAYYMRSNSAGDTGEVTDDGTGVDTGGTGEGTWPYGYPNGVGQTGSNADDDDDDDGTLPTTNEQWQRRAVQVLVGLGYEPTAVDRAIGHYLGGESLTTIERAIINEAILRIGPPPVSPPPPTSPDQPPPTTTPPKPKPPKPTPPTPTIPTKPPKPWNPTKPKPTPTKPKYPKRWKSVVNGKNSSYSSIAAKYKLGISGTELYHYQFTKEAARPASTLATLKKRGPNLIYAAGTTVLPYPK